MVLIIGYKEVSFSELQAHLIDKLNKSGKNKTQIAGELQMKSSTTIANAFAPGKQECSNETLSGIMESIGLDGCIVLKNNKRTYFIKK